jgi:hypothetical protein
MDGWLCVVRVPAVLRVCLCCTDQHAWRRGVHLHRLCWLQIDSNDRVLAVRVQQKTRAQPMQHTLRLALLCRCVLVYARAVVF